MAKTLTITLDDAVEQSLAAAASVAGQTQEGFLRQLILERIDSNSSSDVAADNDWSQRLLAIGRPCGVSLTDEQLSREAIYDN